MRRFAMSKGDTVYVAMPREVAQRIADGSLRLSQGSLLEACRKALLPDDVEALLVKVREGLGDLESCGGTPDWVTDQVAAVVAHSIMQGGMPWDDREEACQELLRGACHLLACVGGLE